MTRPFIVPIDLSDCAGDVVRAASRSAIAEDADLILLHVVQPPEGVDPSSLIIPPGSTERVSVEQHLRQEAERRMQRYAHEASEHGADVTTRVQLGRPEESIVETARQVGAARIVMGTHGRTGLSRLVLGSVAQKVKRSAPCEVELVRTVHKSSCAAGSCAWCASHVTPANEQARAEQDG